MRMDTRVLLTLLASVLAAQAAPAGGPGAEMPAEGAERLPSSGLCAILPHNFMEIVKNPSVAACFAKQKGDKPEDNDLRLLDFLIHKTMPGNPSPFANMEALDLRAILEDIKSGDNPLETNDIKFELVMGPVEAGDFVISEKRKSGRISLGIVMDPGAKPFQMNGGEKINKGGRTKKEKKELDEFGGDHRACPELGELIEEVKGEFRDQVVDPEALLGEIPDCANLPSSHLVKVLKKVQESKRMLERKGAKRWMVATATKDGAAIDKGNVEPKEGTVVLRLVVKGKACPEFPDTKFQRDPFGPAVRCPQEGEVNFHIALGNGADYIQTSGLSDIVNNDADFAPGGQAGPPDRLVILIPGHIETEDWAMIAQGTNTYQNTLVGAGGQENTFFMFMEWGQTNIAPEDMMADAVANIGIMGKLVAKMIMKYIKQQKDEYSSALTHQQILDEVRCVGEGVGADYCGEAGKWVTKMLQFQEWADEEGIDVSTVDMSTLTPEQMDAIKSQPPNKIGRIAAMAPLKKMGPFYKDNKIGLGGHSANYVEAVIVGGAPFVAMGVEGATNFYASGAGEFILPAPACTVGTDEEKADCSYGLAIRYYMSALEGAAIPEADCLEAFECTDESQIEQGTCNTSGTGQKFGSERTVDKPPPPPGSFYVPVGDVAPQYCPILD